MTKCQPCLDHRLQQMGLTTCACFCSTCYEVACNKAFIQDNYGQKLDRTYSCYDDSQSLVVRVTDTCPCKPPQYPLHRWYCQRMTHVLTHEVLELFPYPDADASGDPLCCMQAPMLLTCTPTSAGAVRTWTTWICLFGHLSGWLTGSGV